MLVASSYPFLDVFWTMLIFFLWVAWFIILFRVIGDIFRRHDIGGGAKVLWLVFVTLLPFLGVFIYLIAESKGMDERSPYWPGTVVWIEPGRPPRLENALRDYAAAGTGAGAGAPSA